MPTASDSQQACESNLARTNADEMKATYPGWDFQVVTDVHNVTHSGGPATEGEETSLRGIGTVVAHWLLLGCWGLLLLEIVLAWSSGTTARCKARPRQRPEGRGGSSCPWLASCSPPACFSLSC